MAFSCEKPDAELAPETEPAQFTLSDDQIDEIGNLHNQILEDAINEFDFSAPKPEQELSESFSVLNIPDLNVSAQDDDQRAVQKHELLNSVTPQARSIIESVLNEMKNIDHVEEFTSFVVEKESIAKRILHEEDLTATLIFLNVSKKSAFFWMPETQGGSGIGYSFVAKVAETNGIILDPNQKVPEWFNSVLEADGIAAAGGFLVTAVFIAVSTSLAASGGTSAIAIAGFLYIIAGESALSSGYAALRTLRP